MLFRSGGEHGRDVEELRAGQQRPREVVGQGLPLAVMVTAAALPVGANVFLFAQRYEVGQDEMTAGVTVSTALGMATVPVVLWVVTRWAV